jgi:hypothetical protein
MAENLSKPKTIAIDQETHDLIVHLSKTTGKNNGQLVKDMAKYFSKYGIDPTVAPANLAKEIKNLDKRFISFIRQQEERYLIPQGNQLEMVKREIQKIGQNLDNNKPVSPPKSNDTVEVSQKTFEYYKQIIQNVYWMACKYKLTEKKENVKLSEIAELSDHLFKMK